MEARGEICGGRFVSGFAGEQFALPEAMGLVRNVSRDSTEDRISISALDPLNLIGIVTPGERVPALSGNRVLFDCGVAVAVRAGREVRFIKELPEMSKWEIHNLLVRRQLAGVNVQHANASH